MIQPPKERTVEFERPTYIAGKIVDVGARRAFPTGFAAELVSARKAKFVDPDPTPASKEPEAASSAGGDDKSQMAKAATKGK